MQINIFWFRRDLRLNDNHGFYRALKSGNKVLPIFIFDKNILDELPGKDARVEFLHDNLSKMKNELAENGREMKILYGFPNEIFKSLSKEYDIKKVFTNHDYEPYAKDRDEEINELLHKYDIEFETFKDQVLVEKDDVLKDDGKPYTVYTPYSKKYKSLLTDSHFDSYNSQDYLDNIIENENSKMPSLKDMGFEKTDIEIPDSSIDKKIINGYHNTRNFPAQSGTTRLSVHLRFGTISIRELARIARDSNEKFFNELIWREFYMMILWHFPHIVTKSFKPQYDRIEWRNNEEEFDKWTKGLTGYPIVDAGMRELNNTGYMHNRVRMVVASFLTKHLLIDWRWGERYFAEKLLDFELSSNNGGWQWAAGSGCDAAPYFRIFNPYTQVEKFDEDLKYIRKWIPEYDNPFEYPNPIVEHKAARERALETYKKALA